MLDYSQCLLRPLTQADLERTLTWRNSERVRPMMFTDHIITAAEHQAWFERTRHDATVRHLVFEYAKTPLGVLGVVNVTQIDVRNRLCSWGFYIGETGAPKGSGLALGYLGLEFIFSELAIRKLISQAFRLNTASVGYHRRLGFKEEGCWREHLLKNGKYEDIICFALFAREWEEIRADIGKSCFHKGE
jgi:UDP-4-amino-4,6-dideoxy-N-acetyl-beta-L-altrosamine N-acetyltransferase